MRSCLSYPFILLIIWSSTLIIAEETVTQPDPKRLSPVAPSHSSRGQGIQSQPSHKISLWYGEPNSPNSNQYAASVTWVMRNPTLVALDRPDIKSVECGGDGIQVQFVSEDAKKQAEKWLLPMIIITEGDGGQCAYDGPGAERYHPFYLESRIQLVGSPSTLATFSGYRSRWDVVADHHELNVGGALDNRPSPTSKNAPSRRSLQLHTAFSFSPSLNFNRQKNAASNPNLFINLPQVQWGTAAITCRNCYLDSNFRIKLQASSEIINFGIESTAKLLSKLYKAEQTAKKQIAGSAAAAQHAYLAQYAKLSEQLAQAVSDFYNCLGMIPKVIDNKERAILEEKLGRAVKDIFSNTGRLVGVTAAFFKPKSVSGILHPKKTLDLLKQVKEIVSTTEQEITAAKNSKKPIPINVPQIPPCGPTNSPSASVPCRPASKPPLITLSGDLRANLDVSLNLTGRGELSPGDNPLFSMGLPGLSIPDVITIGPEARFISHTGLVYQRSAVMNFGADVQWSNINIGFTGQKSNLNQGSKPIVNRHPSSFNIGPQTLAFEQHFKPQITFGIDLPLAKQNLLVGTGFDIGFINSLQAPDRSSASKADCQDGIKYGFNISTILEAFYTNPPVVQRSLALRLIPNRYTLKNLPTISLLAKCFKLPASCLPTGGAGSDAALARCPETLKSIISPRRI